MASRPIDSPTPCTNTFRFVLGQFPRRAAIYASMAAIILLPAVWNGFPFVYSDTGGYLIRPFAHDLEFGRSALYGAFLAAGIAANFWPNVMIQALLGAWIISLVLQTEELELSAIGVAVIAALCVGTSLPWYAGQLEPDVFLPLSVLAFYLIAFASPKLRTWQIAALVAVISFSIAAHMSIYAVLLLLFVFCAVLRVIATRISFPSPRLIVPALSLVSGTALALASNYAISGTAKFTPGGSVFLFGRLLQDGFVKTYLDRNCPSPSLSLCRYRDALPTLSGDWLWDLDNSPLAKLGGWSTFTPEADRIIVAIVLQQPGAQIEAALKETFEQLAGVATGDGLDGSNTWHTEWVLKEYAPGTLQRFDASAQQNNAIDFRPINMLHVPLARGATLLLPVLVLLCWRRQLATAALGLIVFAALVANAAVCATFSVVEDRYQSRIVSIGVLAAAVACYRLIQSRRGRTGLTPDTTESRMPDCGTAKQ